MKMNSPKSIQEKCFLNGCLARIILSMLMDADRRNTAEFMNGKKEHRMDTDERSEYFSECLEKLNELFCSFAQKPDRNSIDELRQEMSDQCLAFAEHNGNGIYKLPISRFLKMQTGHYYIPRMPA